MHEHQLTPPTSPVEDSVDDDPEFTKFFQDLLDIPWDEYLAMDAELELENPARAPDAQNFTNDEMFEDHDEPTIISQDEALEQLQQIQKSNLEDIKLFELLEQAMIQIQNKKTITEISSKTKQSSIAKYF